MICFAAVLAAILYFTFLALVNAIKQRAFDPVLGLLSLLIFPVGLVLGVVFRTRKESNITASNAYLLLAFLFFPLASFISLEIMLLL
jgi:hypothetical protein